MSECPPDEQPITLRLTWGDDNVFDIPDTCDDPEGLWWNALQLPAFDFRYNYAPPSAYISRTFLLSVAVDGATMPCVIAARGATPAGLQTQKQILTVLLSRWRYRVTVLVGSTQIGSWDAQPTLPAWGDLIPGRSDENVAEAAVSIPLNVLES